MGEGRIKSAIELAMEKIAGMPSLHPEEIRRHHEKEIIARGEALAQKYLQIKGRRPALTEELSKYSEDEAR